jgi:hypothetical protein
VIVLVFCCSKCVCLKTLMELYHTLNFRFIRKAGTHSFLRVHLLPKLQKLYELRLEVRLAVRRATRRPPSPILTSLPVVALVYHSHTTVCMGTAQ